MPLGLLHVPIVNHGVALMSFCGHLIILITKAVFLLLFLYLLSFVAVNVTSAWLRLGAFCNSDRGLADGLSDVQDTIALKTKLRNTSFEIQHLQRLL